LYVAHKQVGIAPDRVNNTNNAGRTANNYCCFHKVYSKKRLAILIKKIAVYLALAIIRIKQNSASNTN